jgi:hypothetical protein
LVLFSSIFQEVVAHSMGQAYAQAAFAMLNVARTIDEI